jgi:hypothetical protein
MISYISKYIHIYIQKLKKGVRPKGNGLLSYYYHYVIKNQRLIGVCGYDPILGSFSPDLRILIHCICLLIIWSIVLLFVITFVKPDDMTFPTSCSHAIIHVPNTFLYVGSVVVGCYFVWFYYLYYIANGVSIPGPPRKHKIKRQPQWKNAILPIPSYIVNNGNGNQYRLSYGKESHCITEQLCFGTSASITGESYGRDIWTTHEPISSSSSSTTVNSKCTTKRNATKMVDDQFIQEMASGGRSYHGFNPSINPNRYDDVSCVK